MKRDLFLEISTSTLDVTCCGKLGTTEKDYLKAHPSTKSLFLAISKMKFQNIINALQIFLEVQCVYLKTHKF